MSREKTIQNHNIQLNWQQQTGNGGDEIHTTDETAAVIGKLEAEKRNYLLSYFSGAPRWLMDKFQVVRIPAGDTFISEGEVADRVYILLEGRVSAVDYRVQEAVYGFFHFYPIEMFGVMEILGGMDRYMTTLAAIDSCVFLKISRDKFEQWLRTDMSAFRLQAKEIVNYLLEQARKERLYVLLPGNERIYLVLINFYEAYAKGGKYSFYISRKDFAEMTGLSERTITRTIKALEAGDYVKKEGWNITLTYDQYKQLKQLIADRMNEMER